MYNYNNWSTDQWKDNSIQDGVSWASNQQALKLSR
jgi:hypothetical protein